MPTNFRYKFLSFFGSDGSDLNFTFDETTNIWSGTVNIPTVSVNLYESTSIFILEQFLTPGNMTKYGIPHISTSSSITTSGSNWVASWEDDNTTDLKLFQFNPALDKPEIQVVNELEIPVDFDHAQTFDPITGQIITNKIDNKALQINVALSSELEDIFQRVLVITEQNTSTVVAKITFYGETIADDERLNNELVRLGFNVGPEDYPVFRDSDVEEIIPDAELLNAKKKEMLREGHNIKPFIGSYKGLINAIKFYGYNDITLREFWLNVDVNSVNYGKYKLTDVINLFTDSSKRNDDSITLPNNIFKKTNLFSLVYKINEETGFYNADDLPITQPTSQYTFEEVLIKLYGLKNILKKKYLSGNAKIVDIVGEGEFFGRTRIAAWSIGQQIDKINVGIYPSMTVSPDPIGYIQDLRTLESLLFPAATPYLLDPKLTLDSTIKASDIANVLLGYFTKYHPGLDSVAKLEDKEGIPAGYPIVLTNTSFNLTWDQMDITWDQLGITGSLIIDFEPGNIGTGDTFTIKDNQSNQFVSYTTHFGDTVETIVNNLYSQVIAASTIGDGRPWSFYAVSKQDTIGNGHFNVIRFKQIFSGNIGVNLQSTTIGSFGGSPTLTKELITGNTLNTWDNIGIGNFYELEWVIRKPADLTPEYFYSIRGDIGKLNTLAIALPYTGSYSVELILYDTFNQFSSAVFNNAVTVLSKNIEICGFYKFREKDYTWNSIGNITWDEYTSNWELPIVPVSKVEEANVSYESLDRSNYILNDGTQDQRLSYSYGNPEQPGGPDLYTPGPYTWDNLGDVTWDELYHLSWDDMNIQVIHLRILEFIMLMLIVF